MSKQGETQFLTIDQLFDQLKGEVLAKKEKEDKIRRFAVPNFSSSLEAIPVFTDEEKLQEYINLIFNNIPYTIYEIRDGKIKARK
tara:strand:+ start:4843 stop:5097 length:255 start_codon:yes stop_codon:yes gene_type:complete